jgi:hypothetical protein
MKRLFYTYIRQAAEDVSLTAAESARMRATLHSYTQMRPIHAHAGPEHVVRSWSGIFAHPALALVAICAILGSSAGVSYAAESALPGDVLYPIKVAVNEPVRGALATTAKAKADWAIQVTGERAKEAATLAAEHRLDEQTQVALEHNLTEHVQIATDSIAQQSATDPTQGAALASRFEARLSEYERVIRAIDSDTGEHGSLTASIRGARDKVATVRASVHDSSDEGDTAHLSIAARADLASSNAAVSRASDALSPDMAARLAERIDSASNTIALAQDMATSDAPLARGKLRKALRDSETIRTFADTSAAIHDRTGLTISEPVPTLAKASGKGERSGKRGNVPTIATAPLMQASTLAAPVATSDSATTPTTTATTTDSNDSREEEDGHHGKHGEEDKLLLIPAPEI